LLGEVGVNIDAATVSQTTERSNAVMLLRVDRPVDAGVLEPIGAAVGAASCARSASSDRIARENADLSARAVICPRGTPECGSVRRKSLTTWWVAPRRSARGRVTCDTMCRIPAR